MVELRQYIMIYIRASGKINRLMKPITAIASCALEIFPANLLYPDSHLFGFCILY